METTKSLEYGKCLETGEMTKFFEHGMCLETGETEEKTKSFDYKSVKKHGNDQFL